MTNPITPASAPCATTGAHPGVRMNDSGNWVCIACGWVPEPIANIPASTPVQACPDCRRPEISSVPICEDAPRGIYCRVGFDVPSTLECKDLLITRLRQDLATLQASNSVPHPCATCSRPMILPPNGDTRCLACAVAAEKDLATLAAEREAERAAIDSLPEHFSLSVFVGAGLPLAQASIALMVARRVLEDAETDRTKGGG